MSEFKSGFVSIVGRPNAGKSTLINSITGEKIAIVTNKPQTTRNKILGILTEEDCQIIFVDTPGVHRPRTRLGEYMNKVVIRAINEVDAAVLVADAGREISEQEEKLISELKSKKIPTILAINKIDTVNKEEILPLIVHFSKMYNFKEIIPISALKGDGVPLVLEKVKEFLLPGPMFYPEDMITDKTEREIAAEIVREKLLKLLDKEIPHGTAVETYSMKEEKGILKISVNIFCEKDSHKSIIIGKNGAMLKKIGTYAREDIEKFFEKKVFLETWVKVKSDWRNSNFMLKSFGLTDND